MTLTPGAHLGPYEILSPVGAGGMGEVYKARDTRLDRLVAIKILPGAFATDPHARERFDREAKAIGRLTHPHICTLHDVGHVDGVDFLVMEYLDGETLARRLERGALPLVDSLRCAVELAEALEQAHRQGILHSDLKPSNVLLTLSGTKVLDFGIANIQTLGEPVTPSGAHRSEETLSLAGEDVLLGTCHYMAPERLDGTTPSTAADLFALGAVLYEMVTGRKAFAGRDRGAVLSAVLSVEPPAAASAVNPRVPPSLDRLIARCLAKDPAKRWQSAHDLRLELQWIMEHDVQLPSSSAKVRGARRKGAAALIAGLALLAIALGLAGRSFAPVTPGPQTMRFVVNPPEEATLSTAGKWLDVSPDGRWLVFVGVRSDGVSQLWVRPLDSTAARPLTGTEGAISPFWSPDSRFLGFFSEGQLKTIDVFGGVPRPLCEVGTPGGWGGTWNRNGVILFTPRLKSGLWRISAAGGPPTAVTQLDATREERLHTWPQFLPDGRRFLYRVYSLAAAHTGIAVSSLDAPISAAPLLLADSNPMYTGGYLLFGRDGTLFAQPFDARRARLTGDAVALANQVVQNRISGQVSAAVSDTGILAYRPMALEQLEWVDRTGHVLGSVGPIGIYRDPTVSPAGDYVAASRIDPRFGTEDIWVFDVNRNTAARLTFEPAREIAPLFSPDGRDLIFSSNRGGAWHLYRRTVTGAQAEEPVFRTIYSDRPTQWSRRGPFLIFDSVSAGGGKWHVSVLPLDGSGQARIFAHPSFNQTDGQLSPDGRWLAYVSDESGATEVFVRPFPHGESKWQVSRGGGDAPKWRADGQELFYVAPDGSLESVAVRNSGEFDARPPRTWFKSKALSRGVTGWTSRNRYDIAADGQRFLVMQPVDGAASSSVTVVVNWAGLLHP